MTPSPASSPQILTAISPPICRCRIPRPIKVMERAMSQYSFRAAQIATYLGQSRFLDDPALDPFWQAMQEMKVLLVFHPYDEQPAAGLREYFLNINRALAGARRYCGYAHV
jgi:hypothetical protein